MKVSLLNNQFADMLHCLWLYANVVNISPFTFLKLYTSANGWLNGCSTQQPEFAC